MIHFELDKKKAQLKDIEHLMSLDGFWNDQKRAKRLIQISNQLKSIIENYQKLITNISNFKDELELLKEEYSEEMHRLIDGDYSLLQKEIASFELQILLNKEYDQCAAIMEIHPGAGGTESQDWADMLYRMYVRYAEKKGFKVETLDYQMANDAGIKSVSFVVRGDNAYGYLKNEKGVHRLVRISPFDSSGRRHTSFASVDVIPEMEDVDNEIQIQESELRIDTYRSSGAGGQHINKTDSAVRLTHIPTGIVVNCQSQRSQIQNKEKAMLMLKAKLYQKMQQEKQLEISGIRGEQKLIEWGSQVRSYVFCPYLLVKDHRSNFETSDVENVMDGDIDDIIYSLLKMDVEKI